MLQSIWYLYWLTNLRKDLLIQGIEICFFRYFKQSLLINEVLIFALVNNIDKIRTDIGSIIPRNEVNDKEF